MSHQATTWAMNVGSEPGEQRVGDTARKYCLVAMADHAHKNGRNSWCARETLAEYLECSVKSIGRYQAQLIADGFIRRGDQSLTAHIRGDRRPVVFDLAMDEPTRARWAALAAAGDSSWDAEQAAMASAGAPPARRDNLSPRPDQHDGTPVSHGDHATGGHTAGHTGGQQTPHDGTPVSHKPMNQGTTTPQPPASGGRALHDSTPAAGCPCGGRRACRHCGTTGRQVEAAAARAAADARREADIAAAAETRRSLEEDAAPPEVKAPIVEQLRVAIAAGRATSPVAQPRTA